MLHSRGIALSYLRILWELTEALEVSPEIPLRRPTLEKVEACGTNEPEENVDQVDAPSDVEPPLMYKEEAPIEEKKGKLDEAENGAHEHHGYPDMLRRRISIRL